MLALGATRVPPRATGRISTLAYHENVGQHEYQGLCFLFVLHLNLTSPLCSPVPVYLLSVGEMIPVIECMWYLFEQGV